VRSRRFIPLVVFLVTWSLTTHGKYSVTGDEPHYLITATSLLLDGDIDLRNNYDNGNGRLFGSPGLIPELHARAATDGRFLPVHDVGLPVLTLPVLAVALKVSSLVSPSILARFRMTPGSSPTRLFRCGLPGYSPWRRCSPIGHCGPAGRLPGARRRSCWPPG
jgi:hypothetical protein